MCFSVAPEGEILRRNRGCAYKVSAKAFNHYFFDRRRQKAFVVWIVLFSHLFHKLDIWPTKLEFTYTADCFWPGGGVIISTLACSNIDPDWLYTDLTTWFSAYLIIGRVTAAFCFFGHLLWCPCHCWEELVKIYGGKTPAKLWRNNGRCR